MPFLFGMTVILVFQLFGEGFVTLFELPIPGPVLGMLLLFITLVMRGTLPESLSHTADGLLNYLSLFFVPAGVGVVLHVQRLEQEWLPIVLALVISTFFALVTTAATMMLMKLLLGGRR